MKTNESDRYFDLRCGAVPDFKNPKQYVKEKLRILRDDMCIHPTVLEVDHLKSLKTEGDIDRAVHTIIERHWSKYV